MGNDCEVNGVGADIGRAFELDIAAAASVGALPSGLSFFATETELLRRFLAPTSTTALAVLSSAPLETGQVIPRSLPLLATPTPHVRVVLYPEHSLPISMHCVQYGRLRSHLTERLRHVKQSSVAPPAAVLRRLFLGGPVAGLVSMEG